MMMQVVVEEMVDLQAQVIAFLSSADLSLIYETTGGNGANGGKIIIHTNDPSVLALLEIDCSAGEGIYFR